MGFFDFFKSAGEKVVDNKVNQEVNDVAKQAQLNAEAADAIKRYIESKDLLIEGLTVEFDAQKSLVTLSGKAQNAEASEKALLAAGNINGVANVDNQIEVVEQGQQTRYHDVQKGETLSQIAKEYFGDPNQYNKIFEANRPMLEDPDKIYPGQKLRIPA
ncbi:peptidoglycan-binding protein LysM [Rappaport israeli]|uniref:peptidoglycan-binding protein LysM n=1 Tax=Rappaport israeli TaxID=1839807 RepID=UPI00093085E0|nr:peptidoglycan-binding protein LysM [Rappaport israeli]